MSTTPKILKYLPTFLRGRIENRPGLLKILDNIGWLFFDRLLKMTLGLFVSVWVARHLGPVQFGILSFSMAFMGLFAVIATLGLQGIMVRDFVKKADDANVILGTGFLLQVLGGLIACSLMMVLIHYMRPDDALTKTIVSIFGFMQVITAAQVIKYWFESQVKSKFVVWVQSSVFVAISGVKLAMILLNAPLIAFVWAAFASSLLVSILLFAVYGWKFGSLSKWKFNFNRAKSMLSDSWPLLLSGIAVVIYLRLDQIMLGQMIGDEAVGIYSVAVRISELWYFVPMAIVASVFPAIIDAKKLSEKLYYQRFQRLYDLMVWLSIAVALPITFLSTWLVVVLFGHDYEQSGAILSILIWASVFVFLGVASGKWFISEGKQYLSLQRTLAGAVLNCILNFLLIPKVGIYGAAWATIISYAIAGFFYDSLNRTTHRMFLMKARAFNIFRLFDTLTTRERKL